tara:strand:- start:83 stop:754 length:672 start_codon:yes stop_codon:yes gene_type:complete
MAIIYSGNNDGYAVAFNANWVTLKNLTTGTAANASTGFSNTAIQGSKVTLRGGSFTYVIFRSFFEFDTSSITETPTAATLNISGRVNNSGDFFVIASNQGGTLGTGDYDAMVLSGVPGSNDGLGGGDIESLVTKYSAEVTTWSTSGNNSITLNSNALSQIASASTFKIMCMESTHDMRDIIPTGLNRAGMIYANQAGTSSDPYLDVTEAVTVTDNATFFGCNF